MIRLFKFPFVILILLLSRPNTIFSQSVPSNEETSATQKVGMKTTVITDKKRTNWRGTDVKSLNIVIWYPTDESSKSETLLGDFARVPVILDAKISPKYKKRPLILLSHGATGTALHMVSWSHYLASRGYVVASVNHKGDSSQEKQIGPFSLSDRQMWHRPQDMSALLDHLLKDPNFGSKIDQDRIAAGGFSLGGYTVIALAGAKLDLKELGARSDLNSVPVDIRKSIEVYQELFQTDTVLQKSFMHSGDSYKDKRIKGVFALAPAIGEGFTKEGLSDVDIPVSIVVGEKDVVAPKELNAQLYAKGIRGARLTVLPGEVGHITEPGPQVDENWIKVFNLSHQFFQELWTKKAQ